MRKGIGLVIKKTKAKNHKNSGEITVRVLTARTVVPQALGSVHCRLRNRDLKAATVLFVHPFANFTILEFNMAEQGANIRAIPIQVKDMFNIFNEYEGSGSAGKGGKFETESSIDAGVVGTAGMITAGVGTGNTSTKKGNA